MKIRLISLLLALLTALTLLSACQGNNAKPAETTDAGVTPPPSDNYVLKVGTLAGPTGMGMAKLFNDQTDESIYDLDLFTAPDLISAALIRGELDIAAVPVNLAPVIAGKTDGAIQIAAINTLGVLYIVEKGNTLTSLADLEGKTLYATGQGSTPEYMLNYILEQNDLKDKVTIEWKTEHSELATMVAAGLVDYALLPEPHVTSSLTKNNELRAAINLTEEWDKVSEGSAVQGCIVVSKKALTDHLSLVEEFLTAYKASVAFVNANPKDASVMIAATGIVGAAAIAEKAIPRCNIVYIDGDEMVTSLKEFYKVLFNANPQSVGGTLPDDTLYYTK